MQSAGEDGDSQETEGNASCNDRHSHTVFPLIFGDAGGLQLQYDEVSRS